MMVFTSVMAVLNAACAVYWYRAQQWQLFALCFVCGLIDVLMALAIYRTGI